MERNKFSDEMAQVANMFRKKEKFGLDYIKKYTCWKVLSNNDVRGNFTWNGKRYYTEIDKTHEGYSMSVFVAYYVNMISVL